MRLEQGVARLRPSDKPRRVGRRAKGAAARLLSSKEDNPMSHLLPTRTGIRSRVGAAGLAVVAIVLGLFASAGVFAGGTAIAATNSNAEGEVHLTTAVKASPSLKTSEMYP